MAEESFESVLKVTVGELQPLSQQTKAHLAESKMDGLTQQWERLRLTRSEKGWMWDR